MWRAEKGFARKASRMLRPPIGMLGVPAIQKLAREITSWTNKDCYRHMVAYAGPTPPLIPVDLSHNDGLRFQQARVLRDLGKKYGREEWLKAAGLFSESGEVIIRLCERALVYDGKACSELLDRLASIEEKAYHILMR